MKILLALQYWAGDKAQAMELARLISDLEPRHSDDVDFLFVSRFDCDHDLKTVDYVSNKFKVFHHINRHRRGTGWPAGCNDLWFGTMDFVYSWTEAKLMPEYDFVLTFEADCSPLGPHWYRPLMKAWTDANRKKSVNMLGAMVEHPAPHVNGNAMFSGKLPYLYEISRKIGGCSPVHGWDFYLTRDFSRLGWGNCDHIKSFWQRKTMPPEEVDGLIASGVTFLHGVKDYSVLEHVRKRFIR